MRPVIVSSLMEASAKPSEPRESLREMRWHQQRRLAWSVALIAALATMAMIYFARAILFPIALAGLLNLVFKPIVVRAEKWRFRPAWSSAIIMLMLLTTALSSLAVLRAPAAAWIAELPTIRQQLATKLQPLRRPVEQLSEASREVEEMANMDGGAAPLKVRVEQPGITGFLFNTSSTLLATVALTFGMTYFLLAGGDSFLQRLIALVPTWDAKRNVVDLFREIQRSISHYLFTITCINAALGLSIGIGMWALQMPTPALWGVMAMLLNYIPFVGAAVGACVVFIIALLEFELVYAAVAPAAYIMLNAIEANFITPSLLGKSMSLNPVVILLSVTAWGWMWGVGGVFLAVPLLVVFKIVCDHVEAFSPIGQLMEQ